jgi:DNA-binding helix-hairpin-helix protein with protein kinase domain
MLDPFTLIAGATALYNGIKGAVDSGHEMMDVAEKVGSLFGRIAQITQLTSGKRNKRLFQSQAEFEAEAIKLYTLKAKAQQLQLDTRNLFVGAYGIAAWTSIQKEVTEMRKEAARQAAIAMKEAEENRKDLIMGAWLIGAVVLFAACVGLGMVLFTSK